MKKSPVIHFEMPAKDKKRVAKFYTDAFGWDMQLLGPEMGNYVLAGTVDVDEKQMAKTPGAINGGFFEHHPTNPGMQFPHVVISVDNIKESMETVKKAGGKIETEIMDIPGIGKYVSFLDTEDNRVGMLQPSR